MEKKKSPKLEALLQLRKMVEELINEDFTSDKMPKLMALKVTKVTPLESSELPEDESSEDESPEHEAAEGEVPSLSETMKMASESPDSELGTEPCEKCGEMDCGCEKMGHKMDDEPKLKAMAMKIESPAVLKLKKLLGK